MKLKKLVSIVVASAMLTSAAVTTAFAEGDTGTWYESGTGTSSDPYVINTAEQLKGFRDAVNNGACGTLNSSTNQISSPKHLYVELGADIDLGNESWKPIGEGANTFRGTFDGKGHIISNLKIDTAVSSIRLANNALYGSQFTTYENKSLPIYGLFATADDLYHKDSAYTVKGAIKNLGIENVDVAISGSDANRFTSVLVAVPGAHTHIDNCYVKNVNVNLTATAGNTYFGTLAGNSSYNFELKSSYVSGLTFTSNQSSGNVVFSPLSTRSNASTIKDCYSAGVTVNRIGTANVWATNAYYGTSNPENVYSTFTVPSSLQSGYMLGWTSQTYAESKSADLVTDTNLKALNGVSFTDGIFVQNNSGGYPKLSWESNEVVYELTAGIAEGGSVELSSNTVTQNGTVTITVTPNANYSVVNIMANGESIWTGDSTTAVTATHTPTANTTYTATFKKELDPGLGKYIDPLQSKVYNTLDLALAGGSTTMTRDCLLSPEAYTVTNNNDHFTLSTGTGNKDVRFGFYNVMWGTRLLLKSTYDFDIKVNASDLNSVADGEIASVGTAYRYQQNMAATESNVQVKIVFEKKAGGYQWALYRDNNGTYTAIGDKTVPAELGKYYHITYDIDATIAQARIKITPEGGDTQVIESSNTGITRTYEWAFAAANYEKVSESVYKVKDGIGNMSTAFLNFKKEATIDMKGFSTTNDKFICPNDIAVEFADNTITATVDTYAVRLLYDGTWQPATPPLYIAVFDQNKVFKDAAIGQITDTSPAKAYMLYKPTASLDVSGLEDGTYTVKVMLWSDSQVPFKGAVTKTLTVSNGTYTLN